MNKKEKAAAIRSALSSRVSENKFFVLENLQLDEIKTKKMVEVLNSLNVNKALVVTAEKNDNVVLSTRNLPGVRAAFTNTINVYDILKYDTLVITKDAVAKLEEVYA
jgi:large subunit ribosomal protein L4